MRLIMGDSGGEMWNMSKISHQYDVMLALCNECTTSRDYSTTSWY